MYKNLNCTAIVVAGGRGTRFGGDLPKQFLQLGGIPVIGHSLQAFNACPFVDEIVIVVPSQFWDICKGLELTKPVHFTEGGETRQQSVSAGLAFVHSGLVLIHDGARPFIEIDKIETLLAVAHGGEVATLATPVTDTLKVADDNMKVAKTLHRERVFAVQTPQAFPVDIIKKAHEKKVSQAYDDCQLVELLGIKPRLIRGSTQNIKITHPIDLVIAEMILKERSL
ncbi:MAG: 2-C-methyl-D-erythritol 4-phosphate cytidylyltransferase [Defluviitaleaceae bacterium]|nr:2-C-methyl-D-erythritol 4-phosphate cytidylyltransferase [Defluviitaleaceae bacterium]